MKNRRDRKRRREQKQRRQNAFLFVMLGIILGISLYLGEGNRPQPEEIAQPATEPALQESPKMRPAEPTEAAEPSTLVAEEDAQEEVWTVNHDARAAVRSRHVIVYHVESDSVVYEKASETPAYPASLTKIMTHMVAMDLMPEDGLEQTVTMSDAIYYRMIEEDAALSGFLPGETVRMEDLVYANILASGGDAAEQMALELTETSDAFVRLMNEKAQSLGMEATRYANVTGLHDPDHLSSAKDTLTLVKAAMENPFFRELITEQSYRTRPTERHPEGLELFATVQDGFDTPSRSFRLLGGKTGFTEQAGLCLFTITEKDDATFYLITLKAPYSLNSLQDVGDHISLMNGLNRDVKGNEN